MAKKIKELTTATIPLTGGELMEMSQANVSVQVSTNQVKDFVNVTDLLTLQESGDPAQPADGEGIIWMSDGVGLGDAGDVMIATTYNDGEGAVTRYGTLFDHSAGTIWAGG